MATPTIREIREGLGLPPDRASDEYWQDRIERGLASRADARAALQQKKQQMDRISQLRTEAGLPSDPASDQYWWNEIYLHGRASLSDARQAIQTKSSVASEVAQIRQEAGLPDDPQSDAIWYDRIHLQGTHTIEDARAAIAGKAEDQLSPTPGQRDAHAQTQEMLRQYGLESLFDDVQEWINQGLSSTEIMQEIRQTSEYKQRFPGMELRRQQGLSPINEAQYIQLESQYRQILRTAEMPRGYYDSFDDFTNFIAADVSPQELEQRVADGIIAAQTAPAEVRQALQEFYGVGNSVSALASYYLDPEKGLQAIQNEFRAAQIAGAAGRTGWADNLGALDREDAERLQRLGIDERQAQQGFSQLTRERQLQGAMPGEVGATEIDRDEQLGLAFEGDAEAQQELRRQRERRVSAFAGQARSAMTSQEGVGGLRGD